VRHSAYNFLFDYFVPGSDNYAGGREGIMVAGEKWLAANEARLLKEAAAK
jgi:hypothetical protein